MSNFKILRQLVITDVTHFNNEEKVCIAGIDIHSGQCFRPTTPDYLTRSEIKTFTIKPGSVVSGKFQILDANHKPHIEDARYENLQFERFYSDDEFEMLLTRSLSDNIEAGFGINLPHQQKCIPVSLNPLKSLITISVNPKSFYIFQDGHFGKKRIKANFVDTNGKEYHFIPINDLRYWLKEYDYEKLNALLNQQKKVFLRIGIGRFYKNPYDNREGYWIQINGIYSFPRIRK